MSLYEVAWTAFGVASVEADSKEEAEQIVVDGCFNYDDIDFERNDVNGADVHDALEAQ